MPGFSIIIPTYNSEKTIHYCLKSILKQSFSNFEVLIIDGVSSDETLSIAKSFKDQRIKVYSEKDKGIYDAMNKGIRIANGNWLYFLGSDDTLYGETILEEVFNIKNLESYNTLYGNVRIIGNTPWAKHGTIYDGYFDLKKLLCGNISHQAIFYRRDFILNKVGYFELKYIICSDWDFNLRCWSKSPFLYINIVIANFSGGGKSTVHFYDNQFYKDYIRNLVAYFPLHILQQLLSRRNYRKCYITYNENSKSLFKRIYIKINRIFFKIN